MRHKWTDKRVERFKELYNNPNISYETIAEVFGIARNTVITIATRLGVCRNLKHPHDSEWIARLRTLYEANATIEEIAKELGISKHSVYTFARNHGIKRLNPMCRKRPMELSDEQIAWLKAHYPTMTTAFCGAYLGVSKFVIQRIAKEHRLKKRSDILYGNAGQFRSEILSGNSRQHNYREAEIVHKYEVANCYRARLDDGTEYDCTPYVGRLDPKPGERVLLGQQKSPKCREFGENNPNKIKIIKRL